MLQLSAVIFIIFLPVLGLHDRPLSVSVSCNVGVLSPNGWMDQYVTWYGGRPRPGHIALGLDGDPAPPKGAQQPPLFGPCLLWPNCRMVQDSTWHRDRPQPRRHCVRWGSSFYPTESGTIAPTFWQCVLWPNGRPSQQLLSSYLFMAANDPK